MIPENLEKASLTEISWDDNDPVEGDHVVQVQFNPESLKLALTNQNASGDQRGGAAIQYIGSGTSKLSFDLWFDVTSGSGRDVRDLTNEVVFFMTATTRNQQGEFIPPGVRFLWGSFLFEGIMDSLNEDLEYFSEDGRPLRAKLAISLSRQEIRYEAGRQQSGSGVGSNVASRNNQQVQDGRSVSDVAGKNWAPVAAANGIENPLDLAAGTILDLSANASIGASLSAGASFSGGLSASASLGGGLRAGASGGISGGINGGIGAGISGGISANTGIGGGMNIVASSTARFGGAAASASVAAGASFDAKLRR